MKAGVVSSALFLRKLGTYRRRNHLYQAFAELGRVIRTGLRTPRLPGVERTTFVVQANLVRMALEDDEDVHLVVADPTDGGHTMIVEFPDPACHGVVEGTQQAQIAAARAAFIDACGAPLRGRFQTLSGSITIAGVGFFDILHGQSGVAPNGIELHPVLRVDRVMCQATR